MCFTIRRLMIAVAVVAVVLFGLKTAAWVLAEIADSANEPFGAGRTTTQSWDLGPAPDVTVDCFEGTILVYPSPDGRVTAEITTATLAEDVRSAAEEGLKTIAVACDHRGDTLRIEARGASEPNIRKDAHVALYVPGNVRLDLRTGRGEVWVGCGAKNSRASLAPIVARSVRIRNASRYRSGYAEGNVIVATTAPLGPDGTPTPTRLQLDACGKIEINADFALVEARAWHGVPPESWTTQQYEQDSIPGEGTILVNGTRLAAGSDLRAAHGIDLKLPAASALPVDAEATGGPIAGTLLPRPVEPAQGVARWAGPLGAAPRAPVRLRTDAGPITLDGPPPVGPGLR